MNKIALIKCRNGIWRAFRDVLEARKISYTLLDLFKDSDMDKLLSEKWLGIIWTAKHTPNIKKLAKYVIDTFDKDPQIKVFPDWNSYSHYDDKVAQYYLLQKNNIPIPFTKVFYNKDESLNFLEQCKYPIVFKSAHGAGSTNVQIVKSFSDAKQVTKRIFGKGLKTYFKNNPQKGYLLTQEFQHNNEGDYRLVCYGEEVLGFFRENRDDEPLASGSRKFMYKDIPEDMLQFVYEISERLQFNVMSYDIIKGNDQKWVISEISAIYGDINETVYNNAKVYKRSESNSWDLLPESGDHYLRMAGYVLDSWELYG